MRRTHLFLCLAALLVVFPNGGAFGQQETGNCYVQVNDNDGNALPGATVTLTGGGAPRVSVTNAQGQVRFLGLSPLTYSMSVELDGFSTVEYPSVVIGVGRNTNLEAQLNPAVEETITVTSESPLLDERKIAAGTSISQVELEKIPTARDPWAILSQASGVMVDRINVGGNESGQQSTFRGQGVSDDENDFLVDGVQITDMSAIGASPTYYDFDQFQEIQLSTGGTDVTKNTAGVSVNLVTKRGTNEFRGSSRFLLTDGAGYFKELAQSTKEIPSGDFGDFNTQQTEFERNRIERIQDLGFEAGGPVLQDKLWAWASWGQNDIRNIAGGGGTDRTVLEGMAIKLNAQFGPSNSAVGSFNNNDKLKFGRGANPAWDSSATWNQRGPSAISKFEDTHVVNSNFFASAQYSYVDGGFSLTTLNCSGPSCPPSPAPGGERVTDETGFRTNNGSGGNSRPTEEFRVEGSYFFNTGNVDHELKFGVRQREATTSSSWTYPGRNIWHEHGALVGYQNADFLESLGLPGDRASDAHRVNAYRQGPAPITANYESYWLQDTMTSGSWTFNAGLRFDGQDGENAPASVDANPAFPQFAPQLDFGGNNAGGLNWENISLRLGATYALGADRKTLLRASLAEFPEQLSLGNISRMNPVGAGWVRIAFIDDPGGNPGFYDDGEQFAAAQFINISSGGGETPNRNDPGMDAPKTTELILGVEHALLPEFVVGASFTYRETSDYGDFLSLYEDAAGNVRFAGGSDYTQDPNPVTGTLPDGSTYSYPTFSVGDHLTDTGGSLFTNSERGIISQAISLNATKRLANRWMLRGFFNINLDEEWDVPSSIFNRDDPNRLQTGETIDGGLYVIQSTGSGKTDIWTQSGWQANLNGLYQVAPDRPWGFNIAGNLTAREGYPIPYYESVTGTDGESRNILVSPAMDTFRNDDIMLLDLRLDKEFAGTGNTSMTFSLDAFNVLDETSVLQRFDNLNAGNAEHIRETVSARVYRLGVRLNWR